MYKNELNLADIQTLLIRSYAWCMRHQQTQSCDSFFLSLTHLHIHAHTDRLWDKRAYTTHTHLQHRHLCDTIILKHRHRQQDMHTFTHSHAHTRPNEFVLYSLHGTGDARLSLFPTVASFLCFDCYTHTLAHIQTHTKWDLCVSVWVCMPALNNATSTYVCVSVCYTYNATRHQNTT